MKVTYEITPAEMAAILKLMFSIMSELDDDARQIFYPLVKAITNANIKGK